MTDAPALVTVITRRQIRQWGYRSLAEALRHIAVIDIVDDHTLINAGMRGIAGEPFAETGNIKVLIDGNPVSFRYTSGGVNG